MRPCFSRKATGGTSMTIPIRPPFTRETALAKVRAAEDAWNSRDPVHVSLAYSIDSIWRNRDHFLSGRGPIQEFLAGKWQRELDYRLVKELWAFDERRIAVRFQYESHNASGQWFRSYGNELWEFDDEGLSVRGDPGPGGRSRVAVFRGRFP